VPDTDELELVRGLRPEVADLTARERARAEEQLMQLIDEEVARPERSTDEQTTDGARRRRRLAAARPRTLVGTAAAVVLVALVVSVAGLSGRGPSPLVAEPSAAEQLHQLADEVADGNPYPEAPYVVVSSSDLSHDGLADVGGSAPTEQLDVEQRTYRLADGSVVMERTDCTTDCGARVFVTGGDGSAGLAPGTFDTPGQAQAEVERRVDEVLTNVGEDVATREQLVADVVVGMLQSPMLDGNARAELLRVLADTPGLTSEEHVLSDLGVEGTRFTLATSHGSADVLVDPADGYVLETHRQGEGAIVVTGDAPQELPPAGTYESRTSYERPQPANLLPTEVADAAEQLAANGEQLDALLPEGGCVVLGPLGVGEVEVQVAPNLTAVRCRTD
jgi:hypothetical protein